MDISCSDIQKLSRIFRVDVDEDSYDEYISWIERSVSEVKKLDKIPLNDTTPENRSWTEPENDPLNALTCVCEVPPAESHSGKLEGMDVGIKDIIAVAGVPMECGSDLMQGYIPRKDATVVKRLREGGAAITAKTNLDEFAGSAWGTTGYKTPIRNPHDKEHVAGGSSGGSSVAVATGQVDAALGTDTGGSVRIPASFCGLVGLKPTYGLVPLSGVIEAAYSLDHVGPITKTVFETAKILDVIDGLEPKGIPRNRRTSVESRVRDEYTKAVEEGAELSSLRVGVIDEYRRNHVEKPVSERTERVIDHLEDSGATIDDVSSEYYEYVDAAKSTIASIERSASWFANYANYWRDELDVDEELTGEFANRKKSADGKISPYVKKGVVTGGYLIEELDSRHYAQAMKVRKMIIEEFLGYFETIDVFLTPTIPILPPKIEDVLNGEEELKTLVHNTRFSNLTGFPTITIPNGSYDGLPIGLQLIGNHYQEADLLRIASSIESRIHVDLS